MPDRHLSAVNLNRFLVFITILASAAGCHTYTESYENAKVKAQEDALQRASTYTRQAIRDYTNDYGKPPKQLEDLVTYGYFDAIPIDPMTNKADWSIEFEPCKEPGRVKSSSKMFIAHLGQSHRKAFRILSGKVEDDKLLDTFLKFC